MTTFLTNYLDAYYYKPKLQLAITAHENPARVTVTSPFFSQSVHVPKGNTRWIDLPAKTELSGPGLSHKSVRISSNSDITVVTSNIKPFTGDSSVILPTSNLGREYVVFTPIPDKNPALVAIVNGDGDNVVEILPFADMSVEGMGHWKRGKKITLQLKPNEVYQFMSRHTFTGTRILSTQPLAVLVGNQCARITGSCEHVYEQLIPTTSFSNHFLIPGMTNNNYQRDLAYVVAADDDTDVTISNQLKDKRLKLHAGGSRLIPIVKGQSFIVSSNKRVMVMYFGSNLPYDEFLTTILPTSEMSNKWTLYLQKSYINTAVIVSEVEDSHTISGVTGWKPFGSDGRYVWATKSLGKGKGPVTISGKALMAVYVFGGKHRHGYGTTGVCSTGELLFTPQHFIKYNNPVNLLVILKYEH